METKVKLEIVPKAKTSVVLASPEGKGDRVVLLLHGFMSSKESDTNRSLTARLLPRHIATCRFDFFGHGESDGPFQRLTLTRCLDQADGVLRWLKRSGYSRIGLVGSSFGGLVAIHTAARHPDLFAVGLKCPVSDYPSIWRGRLGEDGINRWKETGLLSFATPEGKARLEWDFYEDLLRYDGYRAAGEIQSPTLIVHGDADEYVPFDQSLRLLDALKGPKEFEAIAGANHDFSEPKDFEKMAARIAKWVGG